MSTTLKKDGTPRKPYTLSDSALAQRRGAGRTHGKRTAAVESASDWAGPEIPGAPPEQPASTETQIAWCGECGAAGDDHLKGCSRSDQGATVAAFVGALLTPEPPPVALVVPTLPRSVPVRRGAAGFAEALERGQPEILNPTVAAALETLAAIGRTESEALLAEGLAIDSVVMGAEGPMTFPVGALGTDGRDLSGVVVTERKTNPRAGPTLKVLEMLGHTAPDQALTRKSAGEQARDNSIAGFLGQIRDFQQARGIASR